MLLIIMLELFSEIIQASMEQFFTSPIRRYYELERPHRYSRRKSWPLLVALHGYEGNKDSMMRVASRIGNGNMIVTSLQGPNQFIRWDQDRKLKNFPVGFGWGTAYRMEESVEIHHRDLRKLIRIAVRNYSADPSRVFLLAFSQACSYNYRFAFSHPRQVRGVIAVCGGVPGDWDHNPRYRSGHTNVLHIAATRDQWYSRERNLTFRRQLAQRAASVDFRFYNSTHRFPRTAIPHIRRWIEARLA
jgi:predicted esterase